MSTIYYVISNRTTESRIWTSLTEANSLLNSQVIYYCPPAIFDRKISGGYQIPLVRPSVCPSVRPSVRASGFGLRGKTLAHQLFMG